MNYSQCKSSPKLVLILCDVFVYNFITKAYKCRKLMQIYDSVFQSNPGEVKSRRVPL